MDTSRFADDLALIPARLRAQAGLLDAMPAAGTAPRSGRVLVLGMGSSRYAADVVARRARAQGIGVVVELASTAQLPPAAEDMTVIAVSATGSSVEVLESASGFAGRGRLIAMTNTEQSPLAELADRTVLLHAGVEESGVACRTFRHTFLALEALLGEWGYRPLRAPAEIARAAADASEELLASAASWVPEVAEALAGPMGTWVLGPVERLSSAQQSALMMREVPRRAAYASETGDWSHVDVYLTKTQDYRALVFAGSAWDGQAIEWMRQRGSSWVSVGADFAGAAAVVRYPGDVDPLVATLVEPLVGELVAWQWH